MVHDVVWQQAGMNMGFLCIGCLELRLGRLLEPADFTAAPINQLCPWDTPRLAARKSGRG